MNRKELIAPEQYNIISEMEKYARGEERKALIWIDSEGNKKETTYQQLMKRVNKIGNAFLNEGLKPGDKIVIMIPRTIEAYEVYLAAMKTGIIIIPGSEMLRAKDLQYRIEHGEAKAVACYHPFTSQFDEVKGIDDLHLFSVGEGKEGWISLEEKIKNTSEELEAAPTHRDDTAFLPYTSGTTGNPKGVVHTHGWGYAHLKTAASKWLAIEENDVVWATAGPGWQKWIWTPFLSVLGTGACGLIYQGKFDPRTYLQIMQDYHVNVLCCTPTEYRLMAKVDNLDDYSLQSLHSAVSAGEPLNREVIDTFKNHFNITVRDGYGQTENTLLVGIMKDMEVRPGSMGRPTPGNDVNVINEEGEPAPVGEVGDIAVHLDTPALFKEYYKDPERTKMSRRGDYYITGDQAKKDEEGYFWFEGRSDDIIISSGYTIGPFEVEDALVKHKAVQECAVVASPDEVRGNVVKAFIVLQSGVDGNEKLVKELQDHVKAETAPYKYPRKIEFIEELPKTTSGKIRRIELRKKEK
ncbi:acyl--CoA ligase [Salimicrobium jeotgali]|uniref:Acetate--CoA ligase n=1 Tax=Salimicrobium jeotgali TaxID=1230341 RepID=K2GQ62_9BACI|nr:acyl--CoA ligase [Salimicrobium jeotgali]AKG05112.1 acyl--CoA ligase [Salimicrobium jeotgali]EKE32519.1 acetate--CoA ligase [Salimicrobium jeotgali]MBM7695498.1 acetyl-CoA synthetase [Salimicrobium jeotgali]